MRNHNVDNASDQEFYVLGDRLMNVARKNLKFRYSILKWYYSLHVRNQEKGTVMRPLFFEFYDDEKVYEDEIMNV